MTESIEEKKVPTNPGEEWLQVESLDLDAQGVSHKADGMVVFIEGALPFEEVQFNVHRRKNNWEQGISACTRVPAVAARCSTWTRRPRWP